MLYSVEMEMNVLSALMTVEQSFQDMSVRLSQDDFYASRHQKIFFIIESLALQESTYDAVAVTEHLRKTGELDLVGGEDYMMQILQESAPFITNLNDYAKSVKDYAQRRKLEEALKTIRDLANDVECKDYIEQAQDLISSFSSEQTQKHRYSLREACMKSIDVLDKKIKRMMTGDGVAYGVNTRLTELDNKVGDIEPSHLCVVAGAPGGGKSTLAQMIAINAIKQNDAPTLFISAEMPADQVANRLVSALAKVPFMSIKSGQMSDDEWSSFTMFTAEMSDKYKIDIVDISSPSIGLIRSEARKTVRKHGRIGLIVVDYIQLLSDKTKKNRFEEVSAISVGLKNLAKDFECPVVALAQLTKESISRKPTLSDIRESGQIVQDADQVILLSNHDKNGAYSIINVAKNRHGATGEIIVQKAFDFCRFINLDEQGRYELGESA